MKKMHTLCHLRWERYDPTNYVRTRQWMMGGAAAVVLVLSGCVTQSRYNTMLSQQQAIEAAQRQQMATLQASLQSEIDADQVKIEQLENGIRVRMSSDLLYPSGSVMLSHQGRAALTKVSGQLSTMAAQGYNIDVVGNTDDVPIGRELAARYPTNWELAGARAAEVVRHLQESGVDPTKLEAISNGHYHPVAANDSAEERMRNRRTDIVLRPQ